VANTTKSIKASGGDFTSISAAFAAGANVTSGWWKFEIQDNGTYAAADLYSTTGSPTATNYVWMTADATHHHAGKEAGSHATVTGQLRFDMGYVRCDWLHVKISGPLRGIYFGGGTNHLVSHCLLISTVATTNEAVFGTDYLSVDNCAIVQFGRSGSAALDTGSPSGYSNHRRYDHNTLYNCGASQWGTVAGYDNPGTAGQAACYNNLVCGSVNYDWGSTWDVNAQEVWTGSNNLSGVGGRINMAGSTMTNWFEATSGVDVTAKTSGAWVLFNSITAGSYDLSLLGHGAANLPADNGVNRIGSEPDPRQDFSIDAAGNTRYTSSVDIGAFALTPLKIKRRLAGAWVAA